MQRHRGHLLTRIRRTLAGCAACVVLVCPLQSSHLLAGDWIFQRSYYSHDIPPELESRYPRPRSRSAYRRALVPLTPGIAFRHAHRFNRVYLRSGNSTDVTIYRDHWFQVRPSP